MKYKIAMVVLLLFGLLALAMTMEESPTANVVKSRVQPVLQAPPVEKVIDRTPDFIENYIGTVVFHTNEDFSNKNEGVVEFFSSRKVPGLSIRYRLSDKRLMAGLPMLVSSVETPLDGGKHMVGYTFKKDGAQALVFDNQIVASGQFTGKKDKEPLGMVVGYPPEKVDVEIMVFDKVLSLDDLKQIE
ncbi:MAG: hypothetical protein ABIF10_04050 [Candidatus Woesearchaeota archaeon]